jgi:hypothetical protein
VANYRLYTLSSKQKDLVKKKPLNLSLVELLTERDFGAFIKIVVEPQPLDEFEQEQHKEGLLITENFAVNYGSHAGPEFFVGIYSPNAIRTRLDAGVLYALENLDENKTFFLITDSYNKRKAFEEVDKITCSRHFTLVGDPNEVLEDFKKSGFIFSNKLFERKYGPERKAQLRQAYIKYGLFHPEYNPINPTRK